MSETVLSSVGLISYGAAAVAFGVLAVLLLTRWRTPTSGSFLLLACVLNALWAATLAYQSASAGLSITVLFVAEILRDTAWLMVMIRLWNKLGRDSPRWAQAGVLGAASLVLVAGIALGILNESGYTVATAGAALIPGALLLALCGFFLNEQVFRNAEPGQQWALKFVCIALGGLCVFDLVLYSIAVLVSGINAELWLARGAVNAMLAPVLAVGISRAGNWGNPLVVSRRVVVYGASLAAAGLYLLAMAVVGFYIRTVGGTWGAAAQVVFVCGAIVLLVIVLFSGQVRAWLRVSLAKHLFPYKYDYRVEWLRLIRTLAAGDTGINLATRALMAVAQIVSSNAGGVWVRDGSMFVPGGGDLAGRDSPSEPAQSAFIRFLEAREWIVDLSLRSGAARLQGAELPAWLLQLPRAWLVVPIKHDAQLVAFVVVSEPLAAHELTWEDLDLLRTVGRQIGSYIALEQAANLLAQSRQFEAYNRFAAFMMHDLSNLVAQQRLVVENADRFRGKPEFFDDVIATIDHSVKRMTRLLEQLKRGDSAGAQRRIRLAEVCREAVGRCEERTPRPVLGELDDHVEITVSPERLLAVLEHVIRNAQDATPADGRVAVTVRREGPQAIVEVVDTGSGMDAGFIRERLFRPFDTTKGSQGMGIGAYQAREFARLAGGNVKVDSTPGHGTRFVIVLPAGAASTAARDLEHG